MPRSLLLALFLGLMLSRSTLALSQPESQRVLDRALSAAMEDRKSQKVAELIALGANPNTRFRESWNVLLWAVGDGDLGIVKSLLVRGADIHYRNRVGDQALHMAVCLSDPGIAAALLDAGADVQGRDKRGATPLMLASGSGRPRVVKLLLNRGANIDARLDGTTALFWGLNPYAGDPKVVEILLARGANANERDRDGTTALMRALSNSGATSMRDAYRQVVDSLLAHGGDIHAVNRAGARPLMYAARGGCIVNVRLLLNRGADAMVKDRDGRSALYYLGGGRKETYTDIALTLIEHGAGVHARNPSRSGSGVTVLMNAAMAGSLVVVNRVLNMGADINSQDKEGKTALMYADGPEKLKVILALLDRGANLEARDAHGRTVLMRSVSNGNAEIIRTLIQRGGNVNSRDRFGDTALMARRSSDDADSEPAEAIAALIRAGAEVNSRNKWGMTPIMCAAWEGHHRIIRLLAQAGALVNARDVSGKTALHHAAGYELNHHGFGGEGHEKAVQELLSQGADVHARSHDGQTALLSAFQHNGEAEIITMLLAAGADVRVEDKSGMTSFMWHASRYQGQESNACRQALSEILLSRGARMGLVEALLFSDRPAALEMARAVESGEFVGPKGETALMLAARRGYSDVVDILLEKGADSTSRDEYGRTALHFGVNVRLKGILPPRYKVNDDSGIPVSARLNTIRSLLAHGADPSAEFFPLMGPDFGPDRSETAETPLDWAKAWGYTDIAQVLKDAIAAQRAVRNGSPTWAEHWDARP